MKKYYPYWESSIAYFFTGYCPYCGVAFSEKRVTTFKEFETLVYDYTETIANYVCSDCDEEIRNEENKKA